ncbi:E3 ubiquitin-protein ligase [Striga asiatica]|uniref:E3 ubiquitin-protein ligase n=1 Tax=Striga asiatica TaxID=4170 RepID=A0A5A7PLM0_STRAF|nr:E3 ubiquitin-protein ligase [Striga asiatica]
MPVNTTEPDCVRVNRAKACAHTSSQPNSDDLVDDGHRLRVTKNAHTFKGKKVMADSNKTDGDDVDVVLLGDGTGSEDDDQFPSLITRSSPAIFVKAISGLSDAQRHAVRDMGLEHLLDLTITATPLKMGLWLVNNFNHLDRKLRLYDGEKVHIKEEDVHAALGLPRGEIEIRNKKKRATSDLLDEWVSLFNVRIPSNITASKVLDKMRECEDGGDWFKRHFLVLMVTCLFESSSNGMANFRLVHMLDDLTKVCKMNWCSYMIRCLVDTKRSWDASGKQKKYTGPLLFMTLFYVDNVVLSMRSISRSFPLFVSWTNETLKAREQDEIEAGGFGRGFVEADRHVVVDRHKSDRYDATANNNEIKSTMEPSVQVRYICDAYVQEFASKTCLLATIGDEILQLVNKAPQVLVGDENFMKIRGAAQKLLGVYSGVPKANSDRHDLGQHNHTVPASDMDTDNANGATYQLLDDAFWNDPETLAAIDSILKAVERRDHFKRMQLDVPSFNLGISSDDDDAGDTRHQHTSGIGVGSVHNGMPETADKSLNIDVQKDVGQSEHAVGEEIGLHDKGHRTIDVTKKLDGTEKMVVNWMLKNDASDEGVIAFQSTEPIELYVKKSVVVCLTPGTPITKELLDLWSFILNYNENLRSRGAPKCFFASTSPCNELFFDGKRKKETSYKKFAQTLDSEITQTSIYALNEIQVFLFPVHSETFHGLICVVPGSQKLIIIDSSGSRKDGALMRSIVPRSELLQRSMSKFLGERNLAKFSISVGLAVLDVFDTAWTEGVDKADIGVITMRHMETFKGGISKTWNPGLKRADKGQIKLIRKRYTCVIAFASNNKLKDNNLEEAHKFHPVHLANKNKAAT